MIDHDAVGRVVDSYTFWGEGAPKEAPQPAAQEWFVATYLTPAGVENLMVDEHGVIYVGSREEWAEWKDFPKQLIPISAKAVVAVLHGRFRRAGVR